jgi:bifunctional non-homologous end joining protein LigD
MAVRAEVRRLSWDRRYDPLPDAVEKSKTATAVRAAARHLAGYVVDGEIVAFDEAGRPKFKDLMFGRREPTYVAFDVLFVDGRDVRAAPLKERKAMLDRIVRRHGLETTEPFIGEGRPLFSAVCRLDLEGIVAKRIADPYGL